MARIFITGGSGFIGTNLVEYFISNNHSVINFDIKPPRNKEYSHLWINGDILNEKLLEKTIIEFNPEYVVHLAARTDLMETKDIKGYDSNITGVKNIVTIINKRTQIKRVIYASSRMVCKIDYKPKSFTDFCPPNLYGKSKVLGEEIVTELANHDYVLVRPTSIWGPWFEIPYRTFFETVKKGLFVLPKNHSPKKSFGFVLNTVYQIDKILFTTDKKVEKCLYLTDYPEIDVKTWAELIAVKFKTRKIKIIPFWILKSAASVGDLLLYFGIKNPPLTSFRLNNLITNMVYDSSHLNEICGKLPYSLEEGVNITVNWMNEN